MAKEPFSPTKQDLDLIRGALELYRTSYVRAQKQRPEFAEVAKQREADITILLAKLT